VEHRSRGPRPILEVELREFTTSVDPFSSPLQTVELSHHGDLLDPQNGESTYQARQCAVTDDNLVGYGITYLPFLSHTPIEPPSGSQRPQKKHSKGGRRGTGQRQRQRQREISPSTGCPASCRHCHRPEPNFGTVRKIHNERTFGRLIPEPAVAKVHSTIAKEGPHQPVNDFLFPRSG